MYYKIRVYQRREQVAGKRIKQKINIRRGRTAHCITVRKRCGNLVLCRHSGSVRTHTTKTEP